MSAPNPANHRINNEVVELIDSNYEVTILSVNAFHVKFRGPKDTPYESGIWKVRIYLPSDYPFRPPTIGFVNKIFHPNINGVSGDICLDALNEKWMPSYTLKTILDFLLPQLLKYPNEHDPVNIDAAEYLLYQPNMFAERVREHIKEFATEEALSEMEEGNESNEALSDMGEGNESNDSASSLSDYEKDEAADAPVMFEIREALSEMEKGNESNEALSDMEEGNESKDSASSLSDYEKDEAADAHK